MTAFASVVAEFLAASVVGAPVCTHKLWGRHVYLVLESSQAGIQMTIGLRR